VEKRQIDEIKDLAVAALTEKKAEGVVEIRIDSCAGKLSDYCIVATGSSSRHIDSMAAYVYKLLKDKREGPRVEGRGASGWVLIFAADIEIHLFQKEQRDRYRIESIYEGPMPVAD
jgi:ribosome-associated protein